MVFEFLILIGIEFHSFALDTETAFVPHCCSSIIYVLSAEQIERHDVENVASVANCFEKSRGKNVTS